MSSSVSVWASTRESRRSPRPGTWDSTCTARHVSPQPPTVGRCWSPRRRTAARDATDFSFRDLGEHRLKDLLRAQRLFQVVADGLETTFAEPSSLDRHITNLPIQATPLIGRERELGAQRDDEAEPARDADGARRDRQDASSHAGGGGLLRRVRRRYVLRSARGDRRSHPRALNGRLHGRRTRGRGEAVRRAGRAVSARSPCCSSSTTSSMSSMPRGISRCSRPVRALRVLTTSREAFASQPSRSTPSPPRRRRCARLFHERARAVSARTSSRSRRQTPSARSAPGSIAAPRVGARRGTGQAPVAAGLATRLDQRLAFLPEAPATAHPPADAASGDRVELRPARRGRARSVRAAGGVRRRLVVGGCRGGLRCEPRPSSVAGRQEPRRPGRGAHRRNAASRCSRRSASSPSRSSGSTQTTTSPTSTCGVLRRDDAGPTMAVPRGQLGPASFGRSARDGQPADSTGLGGRDGIGAQAQTGDPLPALSTCGAHRGSAILREASLIRPLAALRARGLLAVGGLARMQGDFRDAKRSRGVPRALSCRR